jgi:peptide/nickel transport system ATP-binding protein
MGLLPEDLVESGSARLPGSDLEVVGASDHALSRVRGRDVAMVFQEPMTALNPTMRVGEQVAEVLLIHRTETDRATAHRRAVALLEQVRLPTRPTRHAPIRTSCPAANGSASSSPSRSRTTRRCSSATSRRRRST